MPTLRKAFDASNWSGPFASPIRSKAGPDFKQGSLVRGASVYQYPAYRPLSAGRPGEHAPPLTAMLNQPEVLTGDGATATAQCLRDQGYDLAILGTQRPAITRQQMNACHGVGMLLHAYVYLLFMDDPRAQVEAALAACEGLPVRKLWLDAEDPAAEHLTEQATVAFLRASAEACVGRMHSGIYTGRGWWMRQTGNYQGFAKDGFHVWHSTADGVGDLTPANYGGWTEPWMEQHVFDNVLCGVNLDLNVYNADVPDVPGPAPEPVPVPTPPVRIEELSHDFAQDDDGTATITTRVRIAQ